MVGLILSCVPSLLPACKIGKRRGRGSKLCMYLSTGFSDCGELIPAHFQSQTL